MDEFCREESIPRPIFIYHTDSRWTKAMIKVGMSTEAVPRQNDQFDQLGIWKLLWGFQKHGNSHAQLPS